MEIDVGQSLRSGFGLKKIKISNIRIIECNKLHDHPEQCHNNFYNIV